MNTDQNKPDRGYAGRPIMTLREIMDAEDDFNLDIAEHEFQPEEENTMAYDDRLTSLGGATYPGSDADMAMKSAYLQQAQYDKRYAGEGVVSAPREAPITRLANAIERLGNAAAFACSTSDLLCGREPANPGNATKVSEPDGLFEAMTMLADRIEHHTDTIQNAMQRIHKIGG